MGVKYVLRDNELVSVEWACCLDYISVHDRVDAIINEGKRTMARQWYFWNCYLSKRCNNGNLAAFPSPFAPHIRTGRYDHAIDFGNAQQVHDALNRHGVQTSWTVRGEGWHLEANADDLRIFFKDHCGTDKYDTLPKHVEVAVKRFFAARNTVRDRVEDRNRIDSKKDPKRWLKRDKKVKRWVRIRARRRRLLERMLKRAKKDRTKKILRQVLDQNPHND